MAQEEGLVGYVADVEDLRGLRIAKDAVESK